jgi:putative ABC transport system permease protein
LIATQKLVGVPDRTIVGLIVQRALALGISGFGLGVAWTWAFKGYFPRWVLMEPRDIAILFVIVLVICLLASALSVQAAVKVDPATALMSG